MGCSLINEEVIVTHVTLLIIFGLDVSIYYFYFDQPSINESQKSKPKEIKKKWIDDLNYYISHIVMKIKKIII